MRSRSMRIAGGMLLYLPSDRISHFRRPSNIRSGSIACQKGKSKKKLKKSPPPPSEAACSRRAAEKRLPDKDKAADAFTSTASELGGAVGRIRTHDPLVRSQILYPTELLPRQNCRSRILANPKRKGKAFCENTANAVFVLCPFSRFACGTVFSDGMKKRPPKRLLQGP